MESSSCSPSGRKCSSPSAERNREPIWNVLESQIIAKYYRNEQQNEESLKKPLRVLEIAAGAGVHMQYFGLKLLESNVPFRWYPTDPDASSLVSQQAYLDDEPRLLPHVERPFQLTLEASGIRETAAREKLQPLVVEDGDDGKFDLILCINMVHISPWSATCGLMQVAQQMLRPGRGMLYLYGPYKVGGTCVESNERFDQWLRNQDPAYGVRNLEDVIALAAQQQGRLRLEGTVEMPANNLSVLFRKE